MSGVYISYPFCAQKCTYCNFASGVLPRDLESRYIAALTGEIAAHDWQWTPETVYLGGGTPSQIALADLECVLDRVPGRPWLEATLEAAPGTVSLENAREWARLGINRVSLGVQSFDRAELARTGRRHDAETVRTDVELLRSAGIPNINIDLIAGLPFQTAASWGASLDWIERLDVPHVSVYMLEVDEDSRLGLEILGGGGRYGAREVPGEDQIAEFYETAVERLHRLGLERYEISNFARPGAESRHNLKYWLLEPYAGFGADAHSYDGWVRRQNAETVQQYIERPEAASEPADARRERLYVGLRLTDGVPWMAARGFEEPVQRFLDGGLLERQGDRLRLTPRGIMLSNEVFQEFIA
jgi:oxygen-independent coproporphyrinogen-3 oxidase